MSIDPRLVERRREVAEDRAKRNVRKLLKFFVFVAVVGSLIWFTLSPWMSVNEVRVTGVQASDTEEILLRHRLEPGTPMILLRTGPAVEEILSDPWVVDARIRLNWPTGVVVVVSERSPRAWVETSGGWTRRAEDGWAVPSAMTPDGSMGRATFPFLDDDDAHGSELVLGSLEFLMNLEPDLGVTADVWFESGELWAVVSGYRVRLGRAVNMREKAVTLGALLMQDLPEGTLVILVAPANPSVVYPEGYEPFPEPEDEDESVGVEGP